jgi:hypothetical protein
MVVWVEGRKREDYKGEPTIHYSFDKYHTLCGKTMGYLAYYVTDGVDKVTCFGCKRKLMSLGEVHSSFENIH